jgi:hypothetical protein
MMRALTLMAAGLLIFFNVNNVLAGMDHSKHAGTGEKNDGTGCRPAKISKFKPVALSEVAPGADFSFMVFDAYSAKHIDVSVSVKKIAVPVSIEEKEAFVLVQGKLPASLKKATVRINVKVKGKTAKCNAEDGWLLKISG